ncbi:hypothetical protein [Bradyrhizobium japonicum]|nr:hypothetical protein [Bradyrhizobium japonicum]
MVLSAFASELYLKCLFVLETSRDPPEIHDLRKLFLLLSQAARDELEAAWNLYAAQPNRVRVYEAIERLTGSVVPRDLRWSLRNGSDAFTSLRYLHEERNQNTKFFLGDFPAMVRGIVLRRRPQWSSMVHTPPKPIP